jgi:hypothetical protein
VAQRSCSSGVCGPEVTIDLLDWAPTTAYFQAMYVKGWPVAVGQTGLGQQPLQSWFKSVKPVGKPRQREQPELRKQSKGLHAQTSAVLIAVMSLVSSTAAVATDFHLPCRTCRTTGTQPRQPRWAPRWQQSRCHSRSRGPWGERADQTAQGHISAAHADDRSALPDG